MLVRALLLAHVALGGASVAVPTAAQLEWMDMEVGAMITYNLQTYCQPASAPASARSTQPCQLAIPGPGIGHKRILLIAPRGALTGIQLRVDSHFADAGQRPTLRSIELFDWGGDVEGCV